MLTRPLPLWQAAVIALAALLIGAGLGMLYESGRQSGKESAAKTVDKVVTQTVTLTDTAQVKQLQQQLAAAKKDAAAFQSQLAEAARAHPAPTACRLPDSLRDDLNR